MSMNEETKTIIVVTMGAAAFITGIVFLIMGPKGCSRQVQSWKAEAYGSDWLIVQYTQSGDIITVWELHNKSVTSETSSDGIYFVDDDGNVVHLSGHYVYIQVEDGNWASSKKRLVNGRKGFYNKEVPKEAPEGEGKKRK